MTRAAHIRKGLLSVGVALGLGFGAVQAFAAPVAPEVPGVERYCSAWSCNYNCQQRGYPGGACESYGGGATYCSCY